MSKKVFLCFGYVLLQVFAGRCTDTYYQELVGYRAAEPVSWDNETGEPIYGAYAFQSDKDGNWYEPSYQWTFGDEKSYVEPTFRQVEAGVYEVNPYTWDEDGKTPVPVYEDYSFVSDKDGRHYKRHYDWERVLDPATFVEPHYVQVLQGYREARELYNCWWSEEGANAYSAVAFRSELDDVLYEPYYEWVRYYDGIEESPKTYSQVFVGYKNADVISHTNGVDVSGSEIDCPVYRKTAFRSAKDGKMYEPVYEWRAGEPLPGRVLKLASVSPEGYVLASTSATNATVVTSNLQYSVVADAGESDVRYQWSVTEKWTERKTSGYYYEEETQRTALIISSNGSDVTSIMLPAVSDKVGGGSYVVVCKAFNDDAEETVTWDIHVPQTYYVSETSLAEAPDGRSWATAYRSIQDAVNVAVSNDVVIVGPGKYGSVSVGKPMLIESLNGASLTIIDPTVCAGGTDACFQAGYTDSWLSGQDVVLRGFTLQNGGNISMYNGSIGGGARGGVIEDCIIRNNIGTEGGGAACSKLIRCVITGNAAYSAAAVFFCELDHCTVLGNRCMGQSEMYLMYSSSQIGREGMAVSGSSVVRNSIIRWNYDKDGNELNYHFDGTYAEYHGSAYYGSMIIISNTVLTSSCSSPLPPEDGNIDVDPYFVDIAKDDFRLRSGSACIARDMGAIAYDEEFTAIATASGEPSLHWAKGIGSDWTATASALTCHVSSNGVTACVDAMGCGSGWLSFEWRVTSASGKDRLGFSLDGVGQKAIVGNCDWQRMELYVAGGETHKFSWIATKAKSGNADADCAYLRNVKWVRDVGGVSVGEALGQPGLDWSADSWRVGQDEDAAGGYYLFADEVQDDAMASVATAIDGPVKLSFDWRVSSEEYCDFLDLVVDGEIVQWLSGETDFEHVEIMLTNGTHSVAWIYSKDESGSDGADMAWLRDVALANETSGMSVSVPYAWLDKYPAIMSANNYDYERAAISQTHKIGSTAVNPSYVWQDYVAGTNPTNESDVLTAFVTVEGGEPVISWKPVLDDGEAETRNYTIWGKVDLQDDKWTIVLEGDEAKYRFFKVSVEMK